MSMRGIQLFFWQHQWLAIVLFLINVACFLLFTVLSEKRKKAEKSALVYAVLTSILGVVVLPLITAFALAGPSAGQAAEMERLYSEAEKLLADKDYDRAEEKMKKLIAVDAKNPRWHALLADVYKRQDKKEDALTELDAACKYDPQNGDYLRARGVTLYALDCLEDAKEAFESAAEAQSSYYKNYEWLGYVKEKLGDNAGAVEAYETAVACKANDVGLHWQLSHAYARYGKYDEALSEIWKAEDLAPGDSDCIKLEALIEQLIVVRAEPNNAVEMNKLGIAYYDLSEFEEALAAFQTAVQIDPQDSLYWYNRGYTYYRLGNYGSAKEDIATALFMSPDNMRRQLQYAKIVAEEAVNIAPQDIEARIAYGYALYCLDDLTNAAAQLERAKKQAGHDNIEVKGLDGTLQQIKTMIGSDLTTDEDKGTLAYYIGFMMYHQDNLDAALQESKKAIEYQPENAGCYDLLGCTSLQLEQYDQAAEAFRRAIALEPDDEYTDKLELALSSGGH